MRAKSILLAQFAKPSEVAATHIQSITPLLVVSNSNANKINEFYEKLIVSVQALDKMHKFGDIKGYLRLTLDKLPGIRADMIGLDHEWQEWEFPKLVESLCKWTDVNPRTIHDSEKHEKYKLENVFQVKEQESKNRESKSKTCACIYCEKPGHNASECESFSSIEERRLKPARKKLCFNRTGGQHRASEFRSNITCFSSNGKYHTSISDKKS